MSDTATTFTAILPVYNRSACLVEAIASILAQDAAPDEVVVVDDGSVEDLTPILAPFGDRIRVHRQPNGGAAAARNSGARLAQGTWLVFLDSDDIWHPGRMLALRRDLGQLGTEERVIAHIGDVRYVGPGYTHRLFDLKRMAFPDDAAKRLERPLSLMLSGMTLQGAAVRRSAWTALGGTRSGHVDVRGYRLLYPACIEGRGSGDGPSHGRHPQARGGRNRPDRY
jgi:glycosyltransferase involved in cell wall biosynthesis